MKTYFKLFALPSFATAAGTFLTLVAKATLVHLRPRRTLWFRTTLRSRIRLDDTLTSVDSSIDDPFSATVVDQGEYQNARVYGHITEIQVSGKVKGHTTYVTSL